MIIGIQDFYYNVTDPKRATSFYTEGLGLKLVTATEYWIALDCNGTTIGLHPKKMPFPKYQATAMAPMLVEL